MNVLKTSDCPFTISYMPTPDDKNINGVVHGGVIFHLCDEAIGQYVTLSGKSGAAADANIHFYRPAMINEKLSATVSERKVGRKLGIYLVEVTGDEGKRIADSLFTVAFA